MRADPCMALTIYLYGRCMPPGVKNISCLIHKNHTVLPTEQPSYIIVRIGNYMSI